MARGKGSKNNDSFRGKPFRGGSTAGSRGQGYRGRARGGRGGAGGRGGYIGYNPSIDTDFLLQTYNDNYDTSRYYSAPSTPQNRGRGRGGGLGSTYSSQLTYGPPVNRGSRGRGRGRGRGGYDSPRNDSNPRGSNSSYVPLSLSLRPLLRPVIFVPATENRFLFQAEEELIQPIVEDAGDEEKSHIPTADRVARVFSGGFKPIKVEDLNDNSEGLEEIDFNDVGKFQEMMGLDSDAAGDDRIIADQVGEVDERFSEKAGSPFPGDSSLVYIAHSSNTAMDEPNDFPHNAEFSSVSTRDADADPRVSSIIKPIAIDDIGQPQKPQTHKMAQHVIPTFFIDADPSRCSPDLNQIPVTDQILGLELGASSTSDALDDGDDIVVYVAPHPRQGRSTAPTPIPWRSDGPSEVSTTSILTGLPIGMAVPAVGPAPTVDSIAFSSLGLSSAGPSRSSDSNLNRGGGSEGGNKVPSNNTKPPVFTYHRQTPAKIKYRQRGKWAAKQGPRGGSSSYSLSSSFAYRGASVSEAQLTNWRSQHDQRSWNPYANVNSPSVNPNFYSNGYPYATSSNAYTYATAYPYTTWDPSYAYQGYYEDHDTLLPPSKVDTTGLLNVLASAQARVQNRPGEEEGEGGLVNEQSLNKRVEESIEGEREGGGGGNDQKTPTPILSFSFTTSPGAAEGMQVDPELEIDLDTMKRFVEGMGPNGSRHVTMYDLEVERRVKEEDAEDAEDAERRDSSAGSSHDDEVHDEVQVQTQELHVHGVGQVQMQVPQDVQMESPVQVSKDVQSQVVKSEQVTFLEHEESQVQAHEDVQSHLLEAHDHQEQEQEQDDEDGKEEDEVEQILDIEERNAEPRDESEVEIGDKGDEEGEDDGEDEYEDKDEEGEDEDEDEDEVEVEVEVEVEDEDEDEDEDDEVEDEVDEDASSDDDEDQSPTSSFQARLERLRKRVSNQDGGAKAKGKERTDLDMDDMFDSEDDWDQNRTWAERDEDFIAHIQDILDQDEDISVRLDKKTQKKVFQAIYNGDFEEEDMWKPARKAKDKDKDLPPELAERWKKDRAKKAIRKQERELSKLVAAADPLTKKKGGKKGRKAMLAAAKLDPTITVLPNRVIDMTTLVQQIRRFIDEIGGPSMMSLPPANKQTRKDIHELASVFNLKSQSKGHGDARYTTLIKTTKTGLKVNNKKVAKIVRRSGGLVNDAEFVGGSDMWQKYAERSKVNKSMPKHREGDEVGKTAPKINETNIGFKMLASMGWSDGDPIGRSGGLQNPLTAVIKHTKLGLGAMK